QRGHRGDVDVFFGEQERELDQRLGWRRDVDVQGAQFGSDGHGLAIVAGFARDKTKGRSEERPASVAFVRRRLGAAVSDPRSLVGSGCRCPSYYVSSVPRPGGQPWPARLRVARI